MIITKEQFLADVAMKNAQERNSFQGRWLSPSKIKNLIAPPVNWYQIAEGCGKNPEHEHFGKDAKTIMALWKAKGKKGASRGNKLDDYIDYILTSNTTKQLAFEKAISDDPVMLAKIGHFNDFHQKHIDGKMIHLGSEFNIFSKKIGVGGRVDTMFGLPSKDKSEMKLMLVDWKNHEKIEKDNPYKNEKQFLLGNLCNIKNCELSLITIQLHLYKYILEQYGYNVAVRVVQIASDGWYTHKPNIGYNTTVIEQYVRYCRKNYRK